MATENIEFKVKIDGVEREIKSVKDLKQAIADLEDELQNAEFGSDNFKKSKEQLDKLTDSLEDMTKSTNDVVDLRKQFEVLEDELFRLAGAGKQNTAEFKKLTIEAATLNKKIDEVNQSLGGGATERAEMGYAKIGESFKKLDFKGVAQGFSMVKTAIAATGVMLFVNLITYLYENFDKLSKGSGGLAKALRFVGDIIGEILAVGEKMLNWVTDLIGLTSESERALEKQGETIVKTSKATKEALDEQIKGFDSQIAIAKAAGKNTVDLEIKKQEAIIETNKKIAEQIIAFARSGGQLTDEQQKLFKESLDNIKKAKEQEQIITLTAQKELNAKRLEAEKKHQEELKKLREQLIDNDQSVIQNTQFALQRKAELEAEYAAQQKAIDDARDAEQMAKDNKEFEEWEKREQRKKDLKKFYENDSAKYSLEITKMTLDSMQNLSDIYFLYKSKGIQKDSKQAEETAKKQFQLNKAIAITSATISGIQGVVNALSAQVAFPEPFATAYRVANAVSVGIAAASNVAKISATQFNSGASSSGGGGSAPSVPIPAPPTAPQPQEGRRSTTFDESGATSGTETFRTMQPTITVKAQVVESDMTDAQKRVNRFDRQTTF